MLQMQIMLEYILAIWNRTMSLKLQTNTHAVCAREREHTLTHSLTKKYFQQILRVRLIPARIGN